MCNFDHLCLCMQLFRTSRQEKLFYLFLVVGSDFPYVISLRRILSRFELLNLKFIKIRIHDAYEVDSKIEKYLIFFYSNF